MKKNEISDFEKIKKVLIILSVLFILSWISSKFITPNASVGTGNVAVIPITGVISVDTSERFSSSTIFQYIKDANENPFVKVIVLDINSPGGSGVAADEIGQAIKESEKPTIAVIREVGASAAYWIASASDEIFANRLSFVGSIGVIGSYLDFSGLIENHNVSYNRIVSGKYKDLGSPFKEATDEDIEVLQKLIEEAEDIFVAEVAANRNLSYEYVDNLSTGAVFLSEEAYELKLIDHVGSKQDVMEHIEATYNITPEIVTYEKDTSLSEFFSFMTSNSVLENHLNPENKFLRVRYSS